jgi:hypothetical protein
MNLTQEEYRIIFTSVRKYQEQNSYDFEIWKMCNDILDKIYPLAYIKK